MILTNSAIISLGFTMFKAEIIAAKNIEIIMADF